MPDKIDWVIELPDKFSELTDIEVIDLSIKKWQNYVDCTSDQYKQKFAELNEDDTVEDIDFQSCALCVRFMSLINNCTECPLSLAGYPKCASASSCFHSAILYLDAYECSNADEDYALFKNEAVKLLAQLKKAKELMPK